MAIVSSTLGSSTMTGWKRRSRAASFSMYFGIHQRGRTDGAQLAAGKLRLEHVRCVGGTFGRPGPDNRMKLVDKEDDLPSEDVTSLRNALRRSSNSPRNFAPAIIAPMSMAMTRLFLSDSGVTPTIRRARPSTIAVLPTPGSPIRTGLFLVRRDRTCMVRDLVVTADHRIDLTLAGKFGKIATIFLEGVIFALGVLIGHALVSANALKGLHELIARDTCIFQQSCRGCAESSRARRKCSALRYSSLSFAISFGSV